MLIHELEMADPIDEVVNRSMKRTLRFLSRSGARALPFLDRQGARVVASRASQRDETLDIPGPVWAEAVRNSWVQPSGSGEGWALSRMGRAQLKRLVSEGDSSASQSQKQDNMPSQPKKSRGAALPHRPGLDARESPIAWLSRRRDKDGNPLLSQTQIDAAERLRADFWFAGMTPRVTTSWSACLNGEGRGKGAPGADIELRDAVVAARERVRRAMAAVGPEFSGLLIDVCCHLKGLEVIERELSWPRRSGKLLLGYALNMLARHYGLGSPVGEIWTSRTAIRHWGVDGYRPAADAAEDPSAGCSAGE